MAFPSNPSVGDTFTLGGKVYRWNGTSWARTAQSVIGQLSSATIADNSIPASKLQANVLTPYALDVDLTTENVTETVELYFSNTRAVYALTGGYGIEIAANGRITALPVVAGAVTTVNGLTGAVTLVTANINEDTNLYFTNARAYANISLGFPTNTYVETRLSSKANVSDLATGNIPESGGRLYFTSERVVAALSAGSGILLYSNGMIQADVGALGGGTITSVAGVGSGAVSNNQLGAAVYGTGVFTTANVIESGNLYYTNARVAANVATLGYASNTYVNNRLLTKANVADLTTSNVSEITNLYYTNARVYANVLELGYSTNTYVNNRLLTKANVADLTTSNVSEGSNQYYTNTRVQAYLGNISGNLIPSVNEIYNLGSSTRRFKDLYLSGNTISLGETLLTTNSTTGGFTISSSNVQRAGSITFSVEANAALVSEIVTTNVITVDSITSNTWNGIYTSNVAETSGNLYFTNARARAALSSGTGVNFNTSTGVIAISQNVDITSNVTFQNLLVTGNLTVTGNTVTLGVTSLAVEDNMIYLNANSEVTNPDLGFAGNYNDGSYHHAGIFRDATDGVWKFFENYSPEPDASPYIDTSHASFRLANVAVRDITGNVIGKVSSLDNFTTSNLSEGTNLYFTNTRVYANVLPLLNTNYITEGSNLYFTNTRAIGALTSGTGISIAANGLIISTAVGGVSSVNGQTGAVSLFTSSNTVPAANVLGAFWYKPAGGNLYVYVNDGSSNVWIELDTPFFTGGAASGTLTEVFGQTQTVSNTQLACAVISSGILTTANTTEDTNLYFTNTRAIGALTGGSGISIAANGLLTGTVSGGVTAVGGSTGSVSNAQLACSIISSGVLNTANVSEGANLYFTNTRAISSLTAGSGVSIAANGRITASETYTGTVTNVLGQTATLSNAQLACATISSGVLNTSNVSEGSNLYFTNTRSISALTAGSGISIAANGLLTGTVSGGVSSVGGSTGAISNAQLACSIVTTGLLNTSNVTEGSNLYFTNTRSIGALTAGSGITIAANGMVISTASGGVASVGGSTGSVSNAQLACSIISSGVLTSANLNPFSTIVEKMPTITGASGAYPHNLNNGSIFYHTSIGGNFTANFTNVPTDNDRTISVALVLVQGGTAYIANLVQIDNNPVTIKWVNGQVPTGSASNVNIESFTLIRTGSAWTVLGSMSTFS